MSTGKFAVPIGSTAVTVPGVYSETDKSAMVLQRGVPTRAMAIVASAKGGAVGAVTRVLRGDEARVLRGGVGAQMAAAAFREGMPEVFFVRVDAATPAILDLTAAGLYAVNPGRASSALQGKTSANATRADAIDLFLKDSSGAEHDETYRVVGPLLDLSYVGGGTAPAGELTAEDDGTVTLTLSATGDASAALSVNTAGVPSVSEFVEAVRRSASWTAKAVGQPSAPIAVALPAVLAFTAAKATLYGGAELLRWTLEVQGSKIARVALPDSAPVTPGTGPGGLRVTGGYEFFAGGDDGPVPTTLDYINGLRLLEGLQVTGVVAGSGSAPVVAALSSHLGALSGVKARRERFGGYGIAPQASKSALLAAALTSAAPFNEIERLVVGVNTAFDTDLQTGALVEQHGAVITAAAIAVKLLGRPEEPLTFKGLKFPRMKYVWGTEDMEDMIEGGCMPVHYDEQMGRIQVMAGVTTYVVDNNVGSRKIAAVDASDYLNRLIRTRVAALSIGKVADELRVKIVLKSVEGVLKNQIRNNNNPTGVLTAGVDPVSGQPLAAYRNLVAVYDGADFLGVDFDANLVGEIGIVRVRPRFTLARIDARA